MAAGLLSFTYYNIIYTAKIQTQIEEFSENREISVEKLSAFCKSSNFSYEKDIRKEFIL